MKKVKKITCIFLILVIFMCNIQNIYAHEYPTQKRYWHDIYYHTGMQKHVARLNYDMDNVTNNTQRLKLSHAINDWGWLDNGFVELNSVPSSQSTLKFSDIWPSTLPSTAFGATVSSLETRQIYRTQPSGIGPGAPQGLVSRINKATVYSNRPYQSSQGFGVGDIAHNWVHEIGHALGFYETNDGTQSAMKQGKGSTFNWSNYWQPQPHDTSDVQNKYYCMTWTS